VDYDAYLKTAKLAVYHKNSIVTDEFCGCYHCLKIFSPSEIFDWCDVLELCDSRDEGECEGETALCPYCGIDAVLGESSGYPVNAEFLRQMRYYAFEAPVTEEG